MFTTIINWFNGKKTAIGAVCLFLALVIAQVVCGQWHYCPADHSWLDSLYGTLQWIGGLLTPVGLIHKAVKQ